VRTAVILAALAAGSMSNLEAAAYLERQPAQEVQLDQLLHAPQAYMNMRVKFRCVFVEHGELYDPIHTQYSSESFINVVAWDDDARIWEPAVRAKPVASMYLSKERAPRTDFGDLRKYQLVDITGEVSSAFRKVPWVNIHTIERVADAGRFSDDSVYHIEQAQRLAADNARDLAETQYVAALEEELPTNGRILIGDLRARNLMAAGRAGEAAAILERALRAADPDEGHSPIGEKDHAALHYQLARAKNDLAANEAGDQARKDLFAQAVQHAKAAIRRDPTQGDYYATLGIAHAGLGEFDDARQQCALAIRMQPNNAETRWYLGRILDQQGQHDEAIEALKKAIDLTPKDARMHAAIANAYLHRGQKAGDKGGADVGTAMREYDIAIRLKPNDAELLHASGQAMEAAVASKAEIQVGTAKQAATPQMAIERYTAAAAANPNHLATHLSLAKAYQASGNNEGAAKHLQAAVEIDPKDVGRLTEVGKFLEGMDRKEEALAVFERAAKINGKNADLQYHIGHLALQTGDGAKAEKALEKAIDLKPRHFAALCDLAEVNLAAGDPKAASKRVSVASDAAQTPADKERVAALKAKVDEALANR